MYIVNINCLTLIRKETFPMIETTVIVSPTSGESILNDVNVALEVCYASIDFEQASGSGFRKVLMRFQSENQDSYFSLNISKLYKGLIYQL